MSRCSLSLSFWCTDDWRKKSSRSGKEKVWHIYKVLVKIVLPRLRDFISWFNLPNDFAVSDTAIPKQFWRAEFMQPNQESATLKRETQTFHRVDPQFIIIIFQWNENWAYNKIQRVFHIFSRWINICWVYIIEKKVHKMCGITKSPWFWINVCCFGVRKVWNFPSRSFKVLRNFAGPVLLIVFRVPPLEVLVHQRQGEW